MRKFFRNAGVMAVAEMIARIKGAIVLPILTRHLGPLDFGVWSQVSMIALLLSPLLSLGSEQGMLRILPGLPFEKQYRMFLAWIVTAVGGAAVCAALLILASSPISAIIFADVEYKRFVVLAAASLFTTLLPNAARAWLRIQNDGNTLAAATVAQAALGIVAVLGAIGLGVSVYGLVLLTLAGDVLLGTPSPRLDRQAKRMAGSGLFDPAPRDQVRAAAASGCLCDLGSQLDGSSVSGALSDPGGNRGLLGRLWARLPDYPGFRESNLGALSEFGR